ncbi:MAG TPA: fructosamine kinase family protein [Steroidobacteraceae bacterium]|nr:fructosamine kinase family protein [Steroidobacteraceae bacterium]
MSDVEGNQWTALADALSRALGARAQEQPAARVHGGCISESYRWESSDGALFVKVAAAAQVAMLEAEAAGLAELAQASAVRVPAVRAFGTAGEQAFLALEWLDLGSASAACEARLGELLAWQHRVSAQGFGWHRDNTIGSTPQLNAWSDDWVRFFRERRLGPQLELARRNGHDGALLRRGARLLELMGAFFASHRPVPSLLHGDLWGGNWAADASGNPVLFDPAVYYGDREADLAMTRLFGGFGNAFYTAYHSTWPLDQAAGTRRALYNLYHVLNHLNLFGVGYREQAQSMIDRLLAELGH